MVYKFFDEKSEGSGVNIPLDFNEQLAKELHKTIIRSFKKRTVYYGCKDNIWGTDLDDMQLIRVVPLKDKKGFSTFDVFQKILDKSGRKPNKIWFDKGSEFYNNSFKKSLKDNDIEMYTIHKEGKSVVAKRFIRTLKTKIYK